MQFSVRHLLNRYVYLGLGVVPILPFVGIGVLERKDCSGHANTLRCAEELGFEGCNTSRAAHVYGVGKVSMRTYPEYTVSFETPRCPANAVTEYPCPMNSIAR